MSSWRLARSLETLRSHIDELAPKRTKRHDGTIGDASHAQRQSEHNPNAAGVVRALDITHNPANGCDTYALAELLRVKRDPRILYVISNGRIFSSVVSPWLWRSYNGRNPHDKHLHISVVDDAGRYDDPSSWDIADGVRGRQTGIVATVFGGPSDPNKSAYADRWISDDELGVALPARFSGERPLVRVIYNGKSVVASVVDVGPWNTNDPYWERGARPQAESGTDRQGRPTNRAGIDLTPAAARAIGLPGKGRVDWEFVTQPTKPPVERPEDVAASDSSKCLEAVIKAVLPIIEAQYILLTHKQFVQLVSIIKDAGND